MNSDTEVAIKQIITFGTSAGGARPKAVIAYNKKTGEVR
jgi:serine/threonine-protein kinase HipA